MTNADAAHWGEAAFYLSLDIAQPVLQFLMDESGLPDDVVAVSREGILWARNQAQNGSQVSLQTYLERSDRKESWNALCQFIRERLITYARPHTDNIDPIERTIFEQEAANQANSIAKKDVRGMVLANLDEARCEKMLELLFAVDRMIACEEMSHWDAAIIERNAESYSNVDPLGHLFDTFSLAERSRAVQRTIIDNPGVAWSDIRMTLGSDRRKI